MKTGVAPVRVVRPASGKKPTIFTIGYEQRDGKEFIRDLKKAGVEYVADVRAKPLSHKPEFRMKALKALCEKSGLVYASWTRLGATPAQREKLKETGDLGAFFRSFRKHAKATMDGPLDELAAVAKKTPVALLCYERAHDECHRSVIAEMLADRLDAGITAIL
jgi:uncharacterized protein (DUF488 family)